MIIAPPDQKRSFATKSLTSDLVVVGGGMAGVAASITAARQGLDVILVQDRPVLGGNASSEVRLWMLGATAQGWNNNRWAREGGVIDEIMVENMFRNPEGNAPIFDSLVLEKVVDEPRITLLLNTTVMDLDKSGDSAIRRVRGFNSQNSTMYELEAPLFCDASGDGVVGFLAGAAFRMGAEGRDEFGEKFAPAEEYGQMLGHSMYFYSRDAGRPVKYTPPSFALKDIEGTIPRYRDFNTKDHGTRLWWIEFGGRLDTIHDTEQIKWELWKVIYGVWNYIKNSGKFPDAQNLTLEWVSMIPGKRESRRFEGDYILRQQDIISGGPHYDAVSYGGWNIDLHPADGVYSDFDGNTHWHAKSPYQIPYRCLYSRNIENLFLAGRIISCSHVAFGTTRTIATCANSAQAVGVAATLCRRMNVKPADLASPDLVHQLQQRLLATGQHVPGLRLDDGADRARSASVTASSQLKLAELPGSSHRVSLRRAIAQMLPVAAGRVPEATFFVDAVRPTRLQFELRTCSRPGAFTPDILLATSETKVQAGECLPVTTEFAADIDQDRYLFYCLSENDNVEIHTSESRISCLLSVAKLDNQKPPEDLGVDEFMRWVPSRRPEGRNLAFRLSQPLASFGPEMALTGVDRPTNVSNAWVADVEDPRPALSLTWPSPVSVNSIILTFDTDRDHPMESVLMGHPESAMPFCVKAYRVLDDRRNVLIDIPDNHQTRRVHELAAAVNTRQLTVEVKEVWGACPAAIFGIRVL